MKIGHNSDQPLATKGTTAAAEATQTVPARDAAAATAAKPDASAKVEISSTAGALLAGGAPEFDAAKVAKVASAIDAGTYKVNHEAIADKLIANAKELLTKAGR